MDLSQGLMLFGVCLIPLYAWLQKFPEEQVQDINDVLQDFRTGEEPALLKWVEDNSLDVIKRHLEYFGVKRVVDVLGLDWKSFEPILGERAAANLRNRRKSMASLGLTKWLRQKGVQDMGSLVLVGDQGECCKDLCLWTQLDVKEISRQLPKIEDKIYFKSAVEEVKPVLCPSETGSRGWSSRFFWLLVVFIMSNTFVIGMVVLYFGVLAVMLIIFIFIVLITNIRNRVFHPNPGVGFFHPNPGVGYFPPKPGIGFVSFVCAVLVSLLQKLWTNFIWVLNRGNNGMGGGRGARRRSQPASTADTPRAAEFFLNLYERFRGTYIDMGKCVLEWNHQDNTQVGGSTVLTVKMVCKNGTPYEFKPSDAMTCKVVATSAQSTSVPHEVEPTSLIDRTPSRCLLPPKWREDSSFLSRSTTCSRLPQLLP